MDEQQLQDAFSAGDEAALSAAIDRYGQSLLRYCHHILCDYHEAQDAVQDTFFKAWRYRERLKAAPLQPWLYRLAYTACIDQIRRRKRQLFAPLPALIRPGLHRRGPAPRPAYPQAGGAGPGLWPGHGGTAL